MLDDFLCEIQSDELAPTEYDEFFLSEFYSD